jgi:hypothetical protein
MNKLSALPLTLRFVVLVCCMTILTSLFAQFFFTRQGRADLETRLREKSTFVNSFYSFLIADALIRKDDVTLLHVVNRLEDDQEITSVIVVDQSNRVRYHIDPQKMGAALEDPLITNALQNGQAVVTTYANSGGRALALVSPLKVQGNERPIGALRIDLTYRRIEAQLQAPRQRYWFVTLGTLVTFGGLIVTALGLWVTGPLNRLRTSLASISTAALESNLPETPDDFGQVNKAINDLIMRFKTDWQQQWTNQQQRGEQEKLWTHRLLSSLLPDARIIVADKDNRIISDSLNGTPAGSKPRHLLDLIKDANFATLLNNAFQKEGETMRGSVMLQDKMYTASILSVPLQQSALVKTLIALQPN